MLIYHKHHVIPKHMGGTDDPSNIVELTVEEHAEAHRKLYEEYGMWQDELAWKGLAGIIGHEEVVREANRQSKLGKKHPHTVEWDRKISMAQKGKPKSAITKRNIQRAAANRRGKTWIVDPITNKRVWI